MYTSGGQPLTQYIDGQSVSTEYYAHSSWRTSTDLCPSSNFPLEGRLEDAAANFPREGRPAERMQTTQRATGCCCLWTVNQAYPGEWLSRAYHPESHLTWVRGWND